MSSPVSPQRSNPEVPPGGPDAAPPCFQSAAEFKEEHSWDRIDSLVAPSSVLMVSPEHFEVRHDLNPHMRDEAGALHRVDKGRAAEQWEALRRAYESLGYPVSVLPGIAGLPDMVFAANQALPLPDPAGEIDRVLLSTMRHEERAAEVEAFRAWFEDRGIEVVAPDPALPFEAHGDALWHPRGRVLLMGHGPRTAPEAAERVARIAEVPVALFQLIDPAFYHLDTCLVPIDPERALWVPAAFDAAGRELLEALFPRLIAVPEEEARRAFAANAHCPDGRHLLIDAAATTTRTLAEGEGLEPVPLETSEFRKAGGSVFCMKLMLPRWARPAGLPGA